MLDKLLKQKALLNTILFAILIGGVFAYKKLGKLEDAEIAIKSAVIVTPYPGATAYEVELEVTDVLEKALQKLENVKDITSRSLPGLSEITINIETTVPSSKIPQVWDHLRRKVSDAKSSLPRGAMDPIVNDDFGDVYGIFVAVTGNGYEYREFYNYVDLLRREILNVDGIKRIELFGAQTEAVDISFSQEKLASLSINPMLIVQAINNQGEIVNPGSIISGTDRVRLSVGNKYTSIKEVEDVLVQVPGGGSFRLGNIADVKPSFYEPKRQGITFNGERAISLAISVESGVNVITVGENFQKKLSELEGRLPAGIEVNSVFSQPERVDGSINNFIINLIESVLIVVVVLLFAMGMRSGLLIASGLVFTILGTFIVMLIMDIELQRISLAAIIVAMGMLVDNSIVIADGIIMDLKRGVDKRKAFTSIVKQTAMPLLGATVIAILAFMPLAMSPDSAGEYLSSLFTVLAISLFLSWLFAMVQTPFMAARFFKNGVKKKKKDKEQNSDPYNTKFYQKFRKSLVWTLSHKSMFLAVSILILVVSFYSFRFIKFEFMPLLDYNQFVIEYKMPKGTDITAVEDDINEISKEILKWDDVINVTAAVGSTPARYTLIRPMNKGGSNYAEMIVDVEDFDASLVVGERIIKYITENYPQAIARKRVYGPISSEYEIEVQFSGPDPAVLRGLAEKAKEIMREEPTAAFVSDNWQNKVKVFSPQYSVEQAGQVSISRSDVANAIAIATDGLAVGVMQDGNKSLPIMLKTDKSIGKDINKVASIPVWGMHNKSSVPLSKVTESTEVRWEDNEIHRFNGQRAIRAQCDAAPGNLTTDVEKKLKPQINAIELPDGYSMEWKGIGESSEESQNNLFSFLPLALGLMAMIIIALFNNLKQSAIIFAIFPFAFIGIVFGFIATNAVFTFIGIIGSLGLIGMMIKNSIVLLDEIKHNIKAGKTEFESIVSAAISRMRPVFLASVTTILGMLPLLFDVMFKSMAITIIFGLLFGTLITLYVVPVMYASMFKVKAVRAVEENN
jgi:multidrug efflux pump subunit AcrB